jgi:hypothetical protein
LENYHVSETFRLILNNPSTNVLDRLSPEEYRIVRRRMIESILATDINRHYKLVNNLKNRLDTFDIKDGKNIDKMVFSDKARTYDNQQAVLNMIIHTCDISNPAKPPQINKIWVDLLFIEFFTQGDEEKKLNIEVSPLCDRKITNVNNTQYGFIHGVVVPTFEILVKVIPEIEQYLITARQNKQRYENLIKLNK